MRFKSRTATDLIVIHCSATPPSLDVGAAWIDREHRKRSFLAIGYHFVVKRDGSVEDGRPVDAIGAHAYGHNQNSVGVCWVGGVDADGNAEDNRTLDQIMSLRRLVSDLRSMYPDAVVLGHRDLSPDVDGDGIVEPHEWMKQCPCFDAMTEYAQL